MSEPPLLGEVADIIMGQSPSGSDVNRNGEGVPLLNGPTEFRERHPVPVQWTTQPTKLAKPGDLLFCVRGSTTGRMNVADQSYCIGRGVASIRAKGGPEETNLLLHLLQLELPRLLALTSGSVFPNLSSRDLARFEMTWPADSARTEISRLLSAFDDKIESNRRVIRLSEQLIETSLMAAIAEEGGETVPLSRLARFVNGGAYTKGASGTGRIVIRIAELNSGPGKSTVRHELDVPADHVARPGDILFSWSGSLGVYRWYRDDAIINQHIFKVIPLEQPTWLVYQQLRWSLPAFQQIARDKATTMGHIKRHHLDDEMVLVPSKETTASLDLSLGNAWDQAVALEVENQILERGRDELLPALVSGRLRVADTVAIAVPA